MCPHKKEVSVKSLLLKSSSFRQMLLRVLVRNEMDGVMIPVPRYPLYSALLDILGGSRVEYFLDEDRGWQLSSNELERAYVEASRQGITTRAVVIVNPGNPTGQVMDKSSLKDVARFCADKVCCLRFFICCHLARANIKALTIKKMNTGHCSHR